MMISVGENRQPPVLQMVRRLGCRLSGCAPHRDGHPDGRPFELLAVMAPTLFRALECLAGIGSDFNRKTERIKSAGDGSHNIVRRGVIKSWFQFPSWDHKPLISQS